MWKAYSPALQDTVCHLSPPAFNPLVCNTGIKYKHMCEQYILSSNGFSGVFIVVILIDKLCDLKVVICYYIDLTTVVRI